MNLHYEVSSIIILKIPIYSSISSRSFFFLVHKERHLSTMYVGFVGPKQFAKVMKTTNVARVAITTVKNKTRANLRKKVIEQKSITIAEKKVVAAVARTEGPMVNMAYLVRSSLERSPL